MDWIEIARNVLIVFAGGVAIAVLLWQGHLWWIERQERKDRERMEERYWQEVTDEALDEAEAILKEIQR
jgi:hypothetical protein